MIEAPDRAAGANRDRGGGETRTTRAMDRITDCAVLLLAAWTVIYHLALLVRPPTSVLLAGWLAAAAVLALLYATRRPWWTDPWWTDPWRKGRWRKGRWRPARPRRPGRAGAAPPRVLSVVSVGAGIVAGTCAGLHTSGVPWWCAWTAGSVSVAASAAHLLRRSRAAAAPAPDDDAPDDDAPHSSTRHRSTRHSSTRGGRTRDGHPQDGRARHGHSSGAGTRDRAAEEGRAPRWGTPFALLTGAGFAVASLFIVNSDGDDAYFVSRSVATATTGEIPVKDVIFTPGTADAIAGEPPVSSIEVLAGALARLLGVPAASFVWYLLLPAVTFLAIWALWRLVRAWAPRRATLCFAVAATYLLWSGASTASLGSFHLLRMWQGKAMLVSVLVPLLLVYLTRWAGRRSRADLALLAAAGVAAAGLTSTAAFVVPLVVGAAAVPLIAAGQVRTGLAACAALAYPVGAGLAVLLFHGDTSVAGTVHDGAGSYRHVLLQAVPGVLAGCALWLSPWTARRGVPALIATGTAAGFTVLLVPGVLETAADLSGAGQVLWRTMWIVPAPVLIGLLATPPVPAGWPGAVRALAAGAPPVALAGALVAGGLPVWSGANGSQPAARPAWKVPAESVGTARSVLGLTEPGGVVLMPPGVMRVVPLLTVRAHAVNPNDHYLRSLPMPRRFVEDREVLTAAVSGPAAERPAAREVGAALRRTGVDVACAYRGDRHGLELLRGAGYGDARRVGIVRCLFPPGT